jgi:hypothetical protein
MARLGNRDPFHQDTSGKLTGIMKELKQDILHCIGNTSLLPLRNIVPKNGSRILLKLENENPTGSMKDRMALAMIEAAEADGRLRANGSVVEYTGGSTGVSLSLICTVKGYPLHIVTSDAFAREKLERIGLPRIPDRGHFHLRLQLTFSPSTLESELFGGVLVEHWFAGRFPNHLECHAGGAIESSAGHRG